MALVEIVVPSFSQKFSSMYIHKTSCISAQNTFSAIDLETINQTENTILKVREPKYEGIPAGILRRMGKAVRIGVGSALPLISSERKPDGIVIGTANGGMEDCIKFLNQIVQYEEGTLTPTNFVQSTPNAIAGQIGLISANHGYNITHVHRGLAFENALLDVKMLLLENLDAEYLLGGLDEISDYNYNIEYLAGWYKKEAASNIDLYSSQTIGSIAGEGSAMFTINNNRTDAKAEIIDVSSLHSSTLDDVKIWLNAFLEKNNVTFEDIAVLISGENGDVRLLDYYSLVESHSTNNNSIVRYKHFSGEYPTASAFALWLATHIDTITALPNHFIKQKSNSINKSTICLLYNTYKGSQHSLMLVNTIRK